VKRDQGTDLLASTTHALSSFIRERLQEFQTGIEEVTGRRENLSASATVILKTLSHCIWSFHWSANLQEGELIESANQTRVVSDPPL
jgi:hypothetical protein